MIIVRLLPTRTELIRRVDSDLDRVHRGDRDVSFAGSDFAREASGRSSSVSLHTTLVPSRSPRGGDIMFFIF
jgi:hypothetical protein